MMHKQVVINLGEKLPNNFGEKIIKRPGKLFIENIIDN
tara:strand:- start:3222 stop:3335 length:114 start_codon:yes stop_codon:yes gene_type:complete